MKCPKCGKEISKAWLSKRKHCPNCGANLHVSDKGGLVAAKAPVEKPKPSPVWYLAAFFGMIVGGIIGYSRVKDRDKKMAKMLLVLGLLMTFVVAVEIMLIFLGIIKL